MVRILGGHAAADLDRPAMSCGDESLTRGELERRANRLARVYTGHGVGYGDLVTIALPNSVEFVVALLATWKLGAVPQPVSSALPTIERQAIVELADSALVHGVDAADHPGRPCLPRAFVADPSVSDAPHDKRVSPAVGKARRSALREDAIERLKTASG